MYPGFYFDRTMILLLPAVIIAFWAQTKVSSTYKKYKSVRTINGYTGENIARMILDSAGLYDVPVVEVRGELTDHYDPVSRQIRLSTEVFHRASIASAGVAAHEVGHAIQHAQAYKPLVLRTSIEFNASKRALNILENKNILYGDEIKGAKSVLSAAAMTYVAAALMSILQLIRLIAISNRNND